jgi:hypothetical protein
MLAHFSWIYVQVMGVKMFGHQLTEYKELGRAMITLIQTTLAISGEEFDQMVEVNMHTNVMTTVREKNCLLYLETVCHHRCLGYSKGE